MMTKEERKKKRNAESRAYYHSNIKKMRTQNKAWILSNKERNRDLKKRINLLKNYGLSEFEFNKMSDQCGFSCEICGGGLDDPKTGKRKTLNVDHCHKTRKIRGLLCAHCNRGLGAFKDSLGLLRNAQQYLLDKG